MTMDDTLKQLEQVFREAFGRPTLALTADTTAAQVDGWDSLKHIELMVAVEEAFDIRLKTVEVAALDSVGALIELIQRKRS